MENIPLRTGKIAIVPMVSVITVSFRALFSTSPIMAYELVMLCRNPKHELFGLIGALLRVQSLVEARDTSNGTAYYVRDQVRDIILASVEGEGMDMHLVNPIGVQTAEPQCSVVITKTANLMDYKLYCAARRVANLICDAASRHKLWFADQRSQGSNPFYNQTANGLFLEFYYGGPSSLWTPWGKYSFRGSSSGNWDKMWEELSGLLGAALYKPEQNTEMGCFGPVFALHKLEGGVLPEPIELAKTHFDPYEKVKNAWDEMTMRYQSEKK